MKIGEMSDGPWFQVLFGCRKQETRTKQRFHHHLPIPLFDWNFEFLDHFRLV